jgi:alpha-L-fucosidase
LHDPRLDWWQDARFGLFLHWGPYSVAGVEASWPIMVPALARLVPQPEITEADYVALPRGFDPRGFDPGAWVALARRAGMRYIVITAKHHDGFCMFDAEGTDYKITRTPYGRDVLAMLAEACHASAMPLGFYYSPPDMHHSGYRDTRRPASENWFGEADRPEWSSYLDAMEAHLRHLLTRYGDVAILWFDGLFDHDRYQPERFRRLVRELSPRTLTNDRLGPGDYVTPEQFTPGGIPVRRQGPAPKVTRQMLERFFEILTGGHTPEEIEAILGPGRARAYPTAPHPSPGEAQPWETCMTMNRCWGWVPTDTEWKSSDRLIRTLVETASRGGNFLLNVGPRGDGLFPPQAIERLRAVGEWMDRNGESVWGTTYGPVQGHPALRSTAKGDTVYLQVLDWPDEALEVGDLGNPGTGGVASMSVLGGGAVAFTRQGDTVNITTPAPRPSDGVSVIAVRRSASGA